MGMCGVEGGALVVGLKGRGVVMRLVAVKRGERLVRMQAGGC